MNITKFIAILQKRLLSTNNEKWNTIPRTYQEIDTLREKFEREGKQGQASLCLKKLTSTLRI